MYGDYFRCIDADQISRGFQPVNPVNFDIKNSMLHGLRDNPFDGHAICDALEHLAKFYEICSM